MNESRIRGKRLLGMGMIVTLLMAVGIWQVSVSTVEAQSGGGFSGAKVVVEGIAMTNLTTAASAAAGTSFYQTGTLSTATRDAGSLFVADPDFDAVGKLRIWGVSNGDGSLSVNVNIELPGFNGSLVGQGTLFGIVVDGLRPNDDIIAITGGTSGFRGASGEASIIRQSDGTIAIRLQEAPRRGTGRY